MRYTLTVAAKVGDWGTKGRNRNIKMLKVQKWKNVRIPEELWHKVKVKAAQKGLKIYEELKQTYE